MHLDSFPIDFESLKSRKLQALAPSQLSARIIYTVPVQNTRFWLILVQLVGDYAEPMDTMDGRIAPQNVPALPPTRRRDVLGC